MLKKSLALFAVLLFLLPAARAERIQIGETRCLLQEASQEGVDPLRRYVLFVGSGDYFNAVSNYRDYTAQDGVLLIPQGNSKYGKPSAASDVVIADLKPYLLAWAQEGCSITLIGYSSGGFPATVLAAYLAEQGYTGTVYILDGIYGDYRGVSYNEEYYRTHLSTWQVIFCTSTDPTVGIAIRSREICDGLKDEDFVTYLRFDMSHNRLQKLVDVILNGAEAPDPLPEEGQDIVS